MSAAMKLAYKRDINDPLVTFCPETLLMRGDREANVIELTVMDGSSPADLSGHTAVVMFQRPGDSDKIRCPGSISGNVISVPLLADCYAYSGQYYASLVLNASGFTRTMLRLAGHVESNGDGPVVDPTGTIPGYEDIARIYAELEASLEESEAATSSANAAAQNANREAEAANLAASNANKKAGVADKAAKNANAAAESIENMTVSATDVAYDQNATATVTDVNGHKHIAFELRQGIPGDVPTITFAVKTGEPGTDVQVEQSGAPDAPTVTLTIPRGKPGEGAVSSVDGLMPGSGGDVDLNAVRYVAQTLDDAQKQQARTNIGAGTGDGTVLSVDDVQPGEDGNVVLSAVQHVAQTLTTEQQQQARINIGILPDVYASALVKNASPRGKNLGNAITSDQLASIASGTFADLYLGDYWVINGVNWRIAAFNYYLGTGDQVCASNHVLIVPDTSLYLSTMNSTASTNGGYVGSEMYTSGLAQAKSMISAAFGESNILIHRRYLTNAVTNGIPSGGAWYDSSVELMTEANVYGGKMFSPANNGTTVPWLYEIDKSQLPLFAVMPNLISNQQTYWLRDVVTASNFARVYFSGYADNASALSNVGVRPVFSIKGGGN